MQLVGIVYNIYVCNARCAYIYIYIYLCMCVCVCLRVCVKYTYYYHHHHHCTRFAGIYYLNKEAKYLKFVGQCLKISYRGHVCNKSGKF